MVLFTTKIFFRQKLLRQLTDDGTHHLPAHIPESFREAAAKQNRPKLSKQATIADLEQTRLAPKVEGRIRILDKEKKVILFCQMKGGGGLEVGFLLFTISSVFILFNLLLFTLSGRSIILFVCF